MPLDAAEFISELSITDPPGTDPLNQGDDHIRTVKRATQQSFPNVDAAVPQTAAQMAQMAIKNEANTFTQVNTFQANTTFGGRLRAIDGSAGNPTYSFTSSNSAGMYLVQLNDLGWAINGSRVMRLRSSEMELTVPIRGQFGAVNAPAYTFDTDEDTGIFRPSANIIGFAAAGVEAARFASTRVDFQLAAFFASAGAHMVGFANSITKTSTSGIGGIEYKDAAGVGRWLVGQSTANNGERWTMQRRNSAGTVQDSPFEVLNTDGHVRILQLDMIRNPDTTATALLFKTAGTITRHTLTFEASGGFNPQSLTFSVFNSSGGFISNPFRIGPNGELFMESLPTTNPGGSGRLWKSSGFVAIT